MTPNWNDKGEHGIATSGKDMWARVMEWASGEWTMPETEYLAEAARSVNARIAELEKDLSEDKAVLCSMKRSFGRLLRFFAMDNEFPPGPSLVPRSHNHKILDCPACARPDKHDIQAAIDAFSYTTPCPHELAEKRLEQFIEKRLEHCVSDQRGAYQDVLNELRRCAGGKEG